MKVDQGNNSRPRLELGWPCAALLPLVRVGHQSSGAGSRCLLHSGSDPRRTPKFRTNRPSQGSALTSLPPLCSPVRPTSKASTQYARVCIRDGSITPSRTTASETDDAPNEPSASLQKIIESAISLSARRSRAHFQPTPHFASGANPKCTGVSRPVEAIGCRHRHSHSPAPVLISFQAPTLAHSLPLVAHSQKLSLLHFSSPHGK